MAPPQAASPRAHNDDPRLQASERASKQASKHSPLPLLQGGDITGALWFGTGGASLSVVDPIPGIPPKTTSTRAREHVRVCVSPRPWVSRHGSVALAPVTNSGEMCA